jgi:hypothetical protein
VSIGVHSWLGKKPLQKPAPPEYGIRGKKAMPNIS